MSNQRPLQVPAAPVMVGGLKGEYHVLKNNLKRQHCPFDAGFDIYPDRSEPEQANEIDCAVFKVHTSLTVTPAIGCYGLIHPRSSALAKLSGAVVRTGVIDSGYTGEILVIVTCSREKAGEILVALKSLAVNETSYAQMILMPCFVPIFQQFDPKLARQIGRGDGGFGHTDKLPPKV